MDHKTMDIEWIIYHLIHNDEDFTEAVLVIDYYDNDVWERLLASLRRNSVLQKVRIERGETAPTRIRSMEEIDELFQALATNNHVLKELELIGFAAFELGQGRFFASFLQQQHHHHSSSSSLERMELQLVFGTLPSTIPQAMATVPTLRHVQLDLLSSAPLQPLCQSPSTVQTLTVECYEDVCFEDDHFLPMTTALCTLTSHLRSLDLEHIISANCLLGIVQVVKHNSTLEDLRFRYGNHGRKRRRRQLRSTSSSSSLPLPLPSSSFETTNPNNNNNVDDGDDDDDDAICQELIRAFLQNRQTSLKRFQNYNQTLVQVSTQTQQLQLSMLEQNYTLSLFQLFRCDDDEVNHPRGDMYLRLNQHGRGLLLDERHYPSTRTCWIDIMARHCHDLDCLYYYLCINPSLCKMEDGTTAVDDK